MSYGTFDQSNSNANRVTIRIWPGNATSSAPSTWNQLGHVALQTYRGGENGSGIYVSMWSSCHKNYDPTGQRPDSQRFCNIKGPHFHSRDTDDFLCAEPPEGFTFNFCMLNVDGINSEFLKFKQSNFNWSIWGGSIFGNPHSQTCSGLIEVLLTMGGIDKLMDSYLRSCPVNEITHPTLANFNYKLSAITAAATSGFIEGLFSSGSFPTAIYRAIGVTDFAQCYYRHTTATKGLHSSSMAGTHGAEFGSNYGEMVYDGNVLGKKLASRASYLTGTLTAYGTSLFMEGTGLVTTPNGLAEIAAYAKIAENYFLQQRRARVPAIPPQEVGVCPVCRNSLIQGPIADAYYCLRCQAHR